MNAFEEKKPLLILSGPTAVGKTAVSVELAKILHGECISADSIQVYRGLDIASGKIKKEEMQGVPHHLLDILNPEEEYDASIFQRMAREKAAEIYARGHLPILVGGTGFYIQAMLRDIDFQEEDGKEKTEIRKTLNQALEEKGFVIAPFPSIMRKKKRKRHCMILYFLYWIEKGRHYIKVLIPV